LGIALSSYCSNNTISRNDITASIGYGICVAGSYNIVSGNNITNNGDGVWLHKSLDSKLYHNNIIDNTYNQVYIDARPSINVWDNGYPSGGNYWSDHTGTDLFRGLYQNETGSDGIGDTPYVIDENNTDTYPLMGPLGPSIMTGENITVFPRDDVGLIFENVTAEGLTTVNKTETGPEPPSGFIVDKFYQIETSASYSGKITIRIIYDDSNMTQEQ
jgi:parallel beta-helix repeat protein